ncbi:MAG: hypothetical protein ACREIM_00065 [Nitrospiraceae bacterium]
MKAMPLLSISVMLLAGLCVGDARGGSTDCMKDADLEKEFGIKIEQVVQGFDKPVSTDTVMKQKPAGTLVVMNRTSRTLYLAEGGEAQHGLIAALPNIPAVVPIVEPEGNTHLWACSSIPPNGSCYRKTLNDVAHVTYQWNIP